MIWYRWITEWTKQDYIITARPYGRIFIFFHFKFSIQLKGIEVDFRFWFHFRLGIVEKNKKIWTGWLKNHNVQIDDFIVSPQRRPTAKRFNFVHSNFPQNTVVVMECKDFVCGFFQIHFPFLVFRDLVRPGRYRRI